MGARVGLGKKGIAITLATPDEVARHPFFREYPVKKFSLQAVPRRKDIEGRVHRDLIQKIQDAPLSVKAKSFVEKLEPEEMKEVILRMFSLMEVPGASKSAGPDELGFKPDQVLSMGQRRPTKRGGFTRGGRKPFTKKGSGKPFRLKKKKW